MTEKDSIRARIIEAAKARFYHYGFGKTTMAELACDCSMSPGNIYRYFAGKLDIAEEIALEVTESSMARLRAVAERTTVGPPERLCAFLREELHLTFALLHDNPKLHELAEIIKTERVDFVNQELRELRRIMGRILADGMQQGVFRKLDVDATAEAIQSATWKFHYPQLFTRLPLDALERELEAVMSLIVAGLTPTTQQ